MAHPKLVSYLICYLFYSITPSPLNCDCQSYPQAAEAVGSTVVGAQCRVYVFAVFLLFSPILPRVVTTVKMGTCCSRNRPTDEFLQSEAQMRDMEQRRSLDAAALSGAGQRSHSIVPLSAAEPVRPLPAYTPARPAGHQLDQSEVMNAVSLNSCDVPADCGGGAFLPKRLDK
jgi:hypothetical protein